MNFRLLTTQAIRYHHYKTISTNGSSEAQVKELFLFSRKAKFRSQDIQVFVF